MDGTSGYELNNTDKLRGPYRNNIAPNNSASLRGGPFVAVDSNNNVASSNNQQINNFQVNGYNSNNLITKNPFPGNNTNFQVEPQQAELNVPGYNHDEPEQLVINNNNNNNNTVEQLTVQLPEGSEGFHGSAHKEHFLVPNKEQFNDNNGLNS